MHRFAPVALATLLAATAPAHLQAHSQAAPHAAPTTFTDPANLRGERVRPRDGRELPIDSPEATGGHGLQQLLRKLNTRASLMLIVAHPDDEDGGLLTYYSRGLGARVAILTLNRGEGGMNAMTGDLEDALGLLRTQELLAADRYMGVDQFFGTEVDFGFSKTKEEAFKKWGHDRVLYDAVRAVRIYRPLVIASVFEGAVTDGHGQHQVSGEIAQEVFKAAGDPNVFPELTREGILPWQPLKVYARVPFSRVTDKGLYDYATGQVVPAQFTNYVTGQTFTTVPSADVTINEGQTDPLLTYAAANPADLRSKPSDLNAPLTYVQFARIGLGLQRSQIPGNMRVPPAGRVDVSYHRYGSKLTNQPSQEKSFFDGIDTSILGLQDIAHAVPTDIIPRLAGDIDQAEKQFNPSQPESVAPVLADALRIDYQLIHFAESWNGNEVEKENLLHELRIKQAQLEEALALALNVEIKATTQTADVIARSTPTVRIDVTSSVRDGLSVLPIAVTTLPKPGNLAGEVYACMPPGEPQPAGSVIAKPFRSNLTRDCTLPARMTAEITRPYFHRSTADSAVYKLDREDLRGAPATPPALISGAVLEFHEATFTVDTVTSASGQPVQIIPPASVLWTSPAQLLPQGQPSLLASLNVMPAGVRVEAELPSGWKVIPDVEPKRSKPGFKQLRLQPSVTPSRPVSITAIAMPKDRPEVTEGFRSVGYGTIPRTNYYTPATLRVVPVDLKLPPENKRRIAYLPGTGDDVPAALASIGLTPIILSVSDLTPDKLKAFDTVILGVRTYNAHPDLHGAPAQALLDFARNGGNVVVQYQTEYLPNEFTSADTPYPLSLDGERVIDETAPVKILDAGSPLMTSPNAITAADFNGWIEERGHGFLDTWDSHYTALTETHDPGAPAEHIADQAPQRGGLITTPLGKGRWTYCAFALYRQLPEAVPGAFRLFVNLLNP